ncbi:OprO/OprP family phosphate-selective porin [Sphingobium sp. BS19]|uniref:OprO/OprP family phosphate-selective porin n=1 Tax=Sphingobium sp. BS19 TaxID=3018973 RepID=UPI0024915C92|nr:porin [Sphingobium sp. BS19]
MDLTCLCSALLLQSTSLAAVTTVPQNTIGNAVPATSAASPGGSAQDANTPHSGQPSGSRIEWRNGSPVLVSADGGTTLRPLGQLIVDIASTNGASDHLRNRRDSDVRAAHLGFAGTVANALVYQVETEFAGSDPDILWAYVGWRGKIAGVGADVLAGNLQNDRSVEGSSGGEALPFAEPNFVASAIAPDRGGLGLGAQARLIGTTWHASFAVTGNDLDARHPQTDSRMILARAHWNPIKRTGAILHLGAWTFDEKFTGGTRTLGANTNVAYGLNLRTVLPSPPLPGATGDRGVGLEAGGVLGPVWMMGEAGRRRIDLPQEDARTTAKSLSAGWFVTGQAPVYAAATGSIGRPSVRRSVFQGGSGQVELTTRYEDIQFNMPGFRNTGSSVTGGVNWYLSSLMRVMVNATAWRMAPDRQMTGTGPHTDHGTTFVLRTQIVF